MAGVQMVPAVAAVDARAEGSMVRKRRVPVSGLFAGDWRRRPRRPACSVRAVRQSRGGGGLGVVCNLGGQYEDSFEDVQLVSCAWFVGNLGWIDHALLHYSMFLIGEHERFVSSCLPFLFCTCSN
jgi:hypothetical protein